MSDKDQFTFDDGDDFPEADLSSAFSDGELEAENQAPEAQEEAAPTTKGKKIKPAKGGDGGSRTRVLLIILLLVAAAGAGAYYFMGLGETTPSVPTAPPAQQAKTAVALPPQPAKPVPTATEEAPKPVAVAVPPPPAPAPVAQPAESAVPAPAPQAVVTETKATPEPAAAQPPAPVAETQAEAKQPAAIAQPPALPVKETPPAAPPAAPEQVVDGAFALDAGSYLFESNRDALIAKIKKLGYEPLVTPVDATLDMTRLRLGTFTKDEVQEALDFARSIEPGSYSAPAGDNYVIYAGTFLSKGNIDSLTKRFGKEGIKVHPEPVQVVRTLSRIRFGSFASKSDAEAAAALVSDKGVKAVIVSAK